MTPIMRFQILSRQLQLLSLRCATQPSRCPLQHRDDGLRIQGKRSSFAERPGFAAAEIVRLKHTGRSQRGARLQQPELNTFCDLAQNSTQHSFMFFFLPPELATSSRIGRSIEI